MSDQRFAKWGRPFQKRGASFPLVREEEGEEGFGAAGGDRAGGLGRSSIAAMRAMSASSAL